MIAALRARLTYANVMATGAVFIALGGGAYALTRGEVKSKHIAKNAVKAKQIRDGHVRAAEIAAGAVAAEEIADGAVAAEEIADGAVGSAKIGSDQVGPDQIANSEALSTVGEIVQPEQTITLARKGSLTVIGECRDLGGGSTEAAVRLQTTEGATKYLSITNDELQGNGVDNGIGSTSAADFADLDAGQVTTVTATAGTTPGGGYLDGVYLLAIAPSGSLLHGYFGGAANVGVDDACWFLAGGFG